MHVRLSTNFSFRRFDLCFRPPLHRLAPEKPHLFEKPLFGRVSLLEISLAVRYRHGYRYESLAKIRVRLKDCQKRRIAEFRPPFAEPPSIFESINIRRITLNRTRAALQANRTSIAP
jgi:hypothetical protein